MIITGTASSLSNYICSSIALAIIILRIVLVRRLRLKLNAADWLAIISALFIICRLCVTAYLLKYGTTFDAAREGLTSADLSSRRMQELKAGAVLSLVNRTIATAFFWLQICIVLLWYASLIQFIKWVDILIKICWTCLPLTYGIVILVTFLECQPLSLYWQIEPDPGQCVEAYRQLFSQCCLNIFLDLLLLVISVPLLSVRVKTRSDAIRIGSMVSLGLICIAITTVRLVLTRRGGSAQSVRSFLASFQVLISTFVSNAPTIYARTRKHRRKRSELERRRSSAPEIWSDRNPTSKPRITHQEHSRSLGMSMHTMHDSDYQIPNTPNVSTCPDTVRETESQRVPEAGRPMER